MTTYIPRPTKAARKKAKLRPAQLIAPKAFTEAELQETEEALDRAYQAALVARVYDYVNKVDRAGATIRPGRPQCSVKGIV